MDTTETYIKMCEKAEEIQNYSHSGVFLHPEKEYWAKPFCGQLVIDYSLGKDGRPDAIWLPRQDEIQGMIPADPETPHYDNFEWRLKRFKKWHSLEIWGTDHPFTSMEQLWLAFAMKEKYGKTWDGAKWTLT